MTEHSTESDALTWQIIAAAYPTHVQHYVQRHGPLPDGPVTQEGWAQFASGEQVTPPGEKVLIRHLPAGPYLHALQYRGGNVNPSPYDTDDQPLPWFDDKDAA